MESQVIIDDKNYMILPNEQYKSLKVKAPPPLNRKSLLTIEEAKTYSKELINKWASEK